MAQKQIQINKMKEGMTVFLGDNTSLHLFVSKEETIFIKLRKEDSSKGRVFNISIDQWEKLDQNREAINEWLNTVNNVLI
jgi:hypothetical protein